MVPVNIFLLKASLPPRGRERGEMPSVKEILEKNASVLIWERCVPMVCPKAVSLGNNGLDGSNIWDIMDWNEAPNGHFSTKETRSNPLLLPFEVLFNIYSRIPFLLHLHISDGIGFLENTFKLAFSFQQPCVNNDQHCTQHSLLSYHLYSILYV